MTVTPIRQRWKQADCRVHGSAGYFDPVGLRRLSLVRARTDRVSLAAAADGRETRQRIQVAAVEEPPDVPHAQLVAELLVRGARPGGGQADHGPGGPPPQVPGHPP